jgi:hypothetical protein
MLGCYGMLALLRTADLAVHDGTCSSSEAAAYTLHSCIGCSWWHLQQRYSSILERQFERHKMLLLLAAHDTAAHIDL